MSARDNAEGSLPAAKSRLQPELPANTPSDAWFRSVVEAANEGIWIIDLEARTIFANERMAALLGTSPIELIGRSPFEFLSDQDRAHGAEIMARNFEGVPVEFEISFQRVDGGTIPVLAGSAPLRDQEGTIIGSVATFSDLTARKEAEQARERTAADFEALADNIPTLCWMAHADGSIYWYNKRWYDYTGTSPESQEGWGWESVHDPAVFPQVNDRWRAALTSATPFEMTFPLRGADGKFRPFLTRVVPIRNAAGEVKQWFGTNTNVEALSKAQDELTESRGRLAQQVAELEALYGSAPIGLAFFDREYRYLRVNQELADINGVPVEAHSGKGVRDIRPANAADIEAIIDRVFESGEAVREFEVAVDPPDSVGPTRHWLTGFYPIVGTTGEVDAVGAWIVEITERKAAEQRELLLAREVDHRAKNLLTVVQSIVQLTPVTESAELKSSIVGRIQALARAHSLLSDARWDGVNFGDLVREELKPFESAEEGRILVNGPALLLRPAAAQSLAMVLHELATNAAKYGALSAPGGTVSVEWHRDQDEDGAYLQIHWVERGGPDPGSPELNGFGSKIIRASVNRQLRGQISKQWFPDGLHCTIRIPASEVVRSADG